MRKTVVVIGGSSGIGKAIAERFAHEGWRIMVGAPDLAATQKVVGNLAGEGHVAVEIDVVSDAQIERLRTQVAGQSAGLHTLINCAGISRSIPLLEPDFAKWDQLLQVMLYGTVKVCRALVPQLEDGGRIINITSIHHDRVAYGSSAYGMAKAAITQLTRALAVELAPRNILTNAIAPGFVNTPMSVKEDGKNELETQWFYDNYIKNSHLPLKRAGTPEEIAGVAWFLAGPDASYMTGSVLEVNGGLTVTF
ncbi:SDR family NAD(P)-dependent oxidoreductase [Tunicatimonas pelagia]|uniref:SDR family NAD(P)-dependent oxidoreductase n=1 Tax=Tunicatimonas pelagia TaxID=931531 RepID=UPI00266534C2|nr:SDR family oxidoreductase [Tunicatimonas pelagia]WKN44334.1 SDR family NAD(P)-dependent oxidoreductase [Tunicatimonas pelagia]